MLTFGEYAVELKRRELIRRGELVPLPPQAFDLLVYLIQNRDRVISKQDLIDAVWGGRIVSDAAVTTRINAVRKAIGDSGTEQRLIRTVARKGMRFVADVTQVGEEDAPASLSEASGVAAVVIGTAEQPPVGRLRGDLHETRRQKPALKRSAVLTLLLLTICLLVWWNYSSTSINAPPVGYTLAVLPFANLSGDPEQNRFADALTHTVAADIATHLTLLTVIADHRPLTQKANADPDPEPVARFQLRGAVESFQGQFHIAVALVAARDRRQLWAERIALYGLDAREPLSEIGGRIANSVGRALIEFTAREAEALPNPDAIALVTLGWARWYGLNTAENQRSALNYFERALEKDPNLAVAMIGAADVLVSTVLDGWSAAAPDDTTRAEKLLARAIERSPESAYLHFVLDKLRRLQDRLAESRVELEIALALDPQFTAAMRQLARTLLSLGEPAITVDLMKRSLRLDPRPTNAPFSYGILGKANLLHGDLQEAIRHLEISRAGNDRVWEIHLWLAAALGLNGDYHAAQAALARATALNPGLTSLARINLNQGTHPKFLELREKTLDAGLLRAGLPKD